MLSPKTSEIQSLTSNGVTGVIQVEESSIGKLCKSFIKLLPVIAIASAQIAFGLAVTVKTIGLGSHVGVTLTNEGINDLIFVVKCLYTGEFSWKNFAKHKIESLIYAGLSCGVGAVLSRGAQASKFGLKIGGESMRHLCGMELMKQVGGARLFKAVTKNVFQKVSKALINCAINHGSDYITNQCGKWVKSATDYCMRKDLLSFTELKPEFSKSLEDLGYDKTKKILVEVLEEVFEEESESNFSKVKKKIGKVSSIFSKGASHASAKTGDRSRMQNAANYLQKAVTISDYCGTALNFGKLTTKVRAIKEKFKQKSDIARQSMISVNIGESENINESVEELVKTCKESYSKYAADMIKSDIVKPVISMSLNKFQEKIEKMYQEYKDRREKEERRKRNNEHEIQLLHQNLARYMAEPPRTLMHGQIKLGQKIPHYMEDSFKRELLILIEKSNKRDPIIDPQSIVERSMLFQGSVSGEAMRKTMHIDLNIPRAPTDSISQQILERTTERFKSTEIDKNNRVGEKEDVISHQNLKEFTEKEKNRRCAPNRTASQHKPAKTQDARKDRKLSWSDTGQSGKPPKPNRTASRTPGKSNQSGLSKRRDDTGATKTRDKTVGNKNRNKKKVQELDIAEEYWCSYHDGKEKPLRSQEKLRVLSEKEKNPHYRTISKPKLENNQKKTRDRNLSWSDTRRSRKPAIYRGDSATMSYESDYGEDCNTPKDSVTAGNRSRGTIRRWRPNRQFSISPLFRFWNAKLVHWNAKLAKNSE